MALISRMKPLIEHIAIASVSIGEIRDLRSFEGGPARKRAGPRESENTDGNRGRHGGCPSISAAASRHWPVHPTRGTVVSQQRVTKDDEDSDLKSDLPRERELR